MIEHVADQEPVLREVVRVLAPGRHWLHRVHARAPSLLGRPGFVNP